MKEEKIDLLLELQNRQMQALERIALLLERIAPTTQNAPNYQRSLEQFAHFDWASIGAEVEREDQHGAAIVNWRGQQFVRRSPSNKFGAAVWFSRCVGKNEETGENVYERLITFKPVAARSVEPLPDKVAARITANGKEQPPLAQVPQDLPQQVQQQPRPQPLFTTPTQSQPSTQGLYPQNNAVVKTVRNATGHSPQAILDWCKTNGCSCPDQLHPEQLAKLIEWLSLGWAVAHTGIPLERLRNSYRGRVGTMTAAGQSLTEAATGWVQAQQERLAK